jgi:murein L,D-transpeptidase YcbB/YkuD
MLDATELIPQEKAAKIAEFLTFAGGLRGIKVTSQDEYVHVTGLCKEIKAAINTIEADRKELVAPYKVAAKEIDERYRDVRAKLENAENVARQAMGARYAEQERKRTEAQRKAEAEAAEARRQAEEKAAREMAKAEALLAQGKSAQAAQAARAEAAEMEASATVAPVIANAAKVEGVSYKTTYRVEVDDAVKAVRGLAADGTLNRFLRIDTTGIEKYVSALGGSASLPEGLRVVAVKTPIVRGK